MFSILLIVVIVFIAFSPVLQNGFVNWDDDSYVIDNALIRSFSRVDIQKIFSSFYMAGYQPLAILSYNLDYAFFKLNPAGYHATNLLLHLLNCILVFWLIFKLSNKVSVSFITALLFSLHPLQVESVAWISERKGLLCAFFMLSSIISFIYYIQDKKVLKYYILSLSLFLLALISKGSAIILPFVLLLIEHLYLAKPLRLFSKDKIPFFILSAIFVIIIAYAHFTGLNVSSRGLFTFWDRLNIAGYSILFYLHKIFIPHNLSCAYTYPGKEHIAFSFSFLISLILVSNLFAARIMALGKRKKVVLVGAIFLVTILPALQFVPVGRAIVSDRYMYFPLLWIFYIISEALIWVLRGINNLKKYYKISTAILISIIFVATSCLFLITRNRIKAWKDSFSLWNEALRVSPCALAYHHLGLAYQKKGDFRKSILNYTLAIQSDPGYFKAYNNRGATYQMQGDLDKALTDYNDSIRINPDYFRAYKNRARIYYLRKEYGQSWENVHKVEELGQKMEPQFINDLRAASGKQVLEAI